MPLAVEHMRVLGREQQLPAAQFQSECHSTSTIDQQSDVVLAGRSGVVAGGEQDLLLVVEMIRFIRCLEFNRYEQRVAGDAENG